LTPILKGVFVNLAVTGSRHVARIPKLTKPRRLRDSYRFPGFHPALTVVELFGDPHARVIRLTRRSKKPCAGCVVAYNGARPLLILLPFGPVGLVYDVIDTEGLNLPSDVSFFPARGPVFEAEIELYRRKIEGKHIRWLDFDAGDRSAREISCVVPPMAGGPGLYQIAVNQNHEPPTRFAPDLSFTKISATCEWRIGSPESSGRRF
jgi:hypothetical protein